MLTSALVDPATLPSRRSLNLALLGLLSQQLEIEPSCWQQAIRQNLKPELHEANLRAFELGRGVSRPPQPHWDRGLPNRIEPAAREKS